MEVEVAVLGGGTAGCAAAITLARAGCTVALIDRPFDRHSRLGHTIAPNVLPLMHSLGVLTELRRAGGISGAGSVSLWGDDQIHQTDALLNPFGSEHHQQLSNIQRIVRCHAVVAGAFHFVIESPPHILREKTRWRLTFVDKRATELSCRWVIDATGRSSWLARRVGCTRVFIDRQIAITMELADLRNLDGRLFLEALPDGWIYANPLPDGTAMAVMLTDSDQPRGCGGLATFWDRQISLSSLVREKIENGRLVGRSILPASTTWLTSSAGNGWLAVGDAVMTHDPLCGCGLRFACLSGMNAANAILSGEHSPQSYPEFVLTQLRLMLDGRRQTYARVNRWAERPYWSRRTKP